MSAQTDENEIVVNTIEDAKKLVPKYGLEAFSSKKYLRLDAPNGEYHKLDYWIFRPGIPLINGEIVNAIELKVDGKSQEISYVVTTAVEGEKDTKVYCPNEETYKYLTSVDHVQRWCQLHSDNVASGYLTEVQVGIIQASVYWSKLVQENASEGIRIYFKKDEGSDLFILCSDDLMPV